MAVLDTTALIDAQRSQPGALRALQRLHEDGEVLRVPASVWMEFLSYVPEGPRPAAIGRLLASVVFEPMTRELAESGAALQRGLLLRGEGLGWHDVHVAVTALHYREAVVTRDKDFARVAGLEVQSY